MIFQHTFNGLDKQQEKYHTQLNEDAQVARP